MVATAVADSVSVAARVAVAVAAAPRTASAAQRCPSMGRPMKAPRSSTWSSTRPSATLSPRTRRSQSVVRLRPSLARQGTPTMLPSAPSSWARCRRRCARHRAAAVAQTTRVERRRLRGTAVRCVPAVKAVPQALWAERPPRGGGRPRRRAPLPPARWSCASQLGGAAAATGQTRRTRGSVQRAVAWQAAVAAWRGVRTCSRSPGNHRSGFGQLSGGRRCRRAAGGGARGSGGSRSMPPWAVAALETVYHPGQGIGGVAPAGGCGRRPPPSTQAARGISPLGPFCCPSLPPPSCPGYPAL